MASKTWRLSPSRKRPGWYILIGPYDDEFRKDLKLSIPARSREWNEGLRAWVIHERALEDAGAVIERHSSYEGPGAEPGVDTLREHFKALGREADPAEICEALALVGEPVSVVVRMLDGQRVVLAVLEDEATDG